MFSVLFLVGSYSTARTYQTEQLTVHFMVCEICLLNVKKKKKANTTVLGIEGSNKSMAKG